MKLAYKVTTGKPYKVRTLKYDIQDEKIREYMRQDSAVDLFDPKACTSMSIVLDAERQRITDNLLRNGYYKFNKEYISYTADTVRNTYLVDLTCIWRHTGSITRIHRRITGSTTINKVSFITDYNVLQSSALSSIEMNDSITLQRLSHIL